MFTKPGIHNFTKVVEQFRHDLALHFSEDYLFEGTEETYDPIHVELPYPIHKPFETIEVDPVKQLLQEKQEYSKLLEVKRKRYQFDKKNISRRKICDTKYLHLPKHLLEFYRATDPDKYFDCDYNFYYTGGFLEHIKINNEDYLICPDGQNKLCLSNLQIPKGSLTLNYDIAARIFNIRAIESSDTNILLFRGKYNLNIATLSATQELNEIWTYNQDKVPLLDAKLNREQHSIIGFVDVTKKLRIRDIETGKTLISYKNENESNPDNFQQLQFLNNSTVVLSDRFTVKFIDCRTKSVESEFNPELIECNSICNFEIRENDFFLASRHYLIKSDVRKLETVSHFSHSLNDPPCYMSLGAKDTDTFLCLSGQSDSCKVLFTGRSVFSLPYTVPGIQNTLRHCLLNNPDMILRDGELQNRLDFSVAGLKLVNVNNEMYIFWVNSLGEVFKQKITHEEPDSVKSVETFTDWVNDLKQSKPMLHLTRVEEMSRARFSLNTTLTESNLMKYKRNDTGRNFLKTVAPIYSKKNVTSTLAQDFLAVWDADNSDSDDVEEDKLPEVPAYDRVNDWIQTNDFLDDEDSRSFPNLSKNQ